MKDCNQAKMDNMAFRYSDQKDAKFLLGAYRSDKNQLAWILGEQPRRYQKIYNVRLNDSLFSQRNGGITHVSKPDYILLYDFQGIDKGYHLFKCVEGVS